jgi:Fe-S cluster biogenesis protein NfuA
LHHLTGNELSYNKLSGDKPQEVITVIERSKVEDALNQIRPVLQRDGGNVELVDVTPEGVVKVKLVGACGTCPMSVLTLKRGIEATLKQRMPEIASVEAV